MDIRRLATVFPVLFLFTALLMLAPVRAQNASLGVAPRVDLMPQAQLAASPSSYPGYSTSLQGNFAGQYVSFPLDNPRVLTPLDASTQIFAGDFMPGEINSFIVIDSESNNILEVSTDGSATEIGNAALQGDDETWTGMAGDPTGETLYASSSDASDSYLYVLQNLIDGTATALRTATVTLDGDSVPGLVAIAFGPDGQLYGYETNNDTFLAIDEGTGAATLVGDIGFDAEFAQGLDYNPNDDTMYMTAFNADNSRGELRTVDLDDGSTSVVGALGAGDQLGYLALPGEATPELAINEFLAAPSTDDGGVDLNGDGESNGDDEFVEVINTSGGPLDISGYQIDNEAGDDDSYTFPDGVTLGTGEAATVIGQFADDTDEDDYRSVIGDDAGGFFDDGLPSLGDAGGDIRVLDDEGNVVQAISYGDNGDVAVSSGVSSARNPDGTGSFQFQNTFGPMTAETAGQDNTDGSPLPVEFDGTPVATADGRAVTLRWATLTETDNLGFRVQHQRVAGTPSPNWNDARQRVEGAGTSSVRQRYAYTVTGLTPGSYRFRVKQVDLDGEASFSGSVEVEVGGQGFVLEPAHPNPLRGGETARLVFDAPEGAKVEAGLFNSLGQQVRALDAQGGVIEVRPEGLASGLYFVRLTAGERTTTQAVTLVR